ncbi:nuclear transport factor 2 family protein [Saccharopolyspora sp. WRP15-2]|uniref:Nuclear transport factor 2 family protein n=1 Tax=Saccharopolyspora oryzae TaxID=2997343 RepID=A0ABT4UQD8_9PSEU|nr:nuclear transport factor 2 family protein [Saccharopolyspora oryzae]MDA3623938.1 nuclear transport factor 2 family protein [Saccharopolyspora oryzae]
MTDASTGATADRIAALEHRLAEVEDRLALLQIVAAYGPAVDSGSAEVTAAMWTADGVYDTFPAALAGQAAIGDMVTGEMHQGLIGSGAAHLLGIPHIELNGDSAVVTNYSQLVLREPDSDGYRIWRTGVNRWEFTRTAEGWRVVRRINRQLDGTAEGRDLLAEAIDPADPGR